MHKRILQGGLLIAAVAAVGFGVAHGGGRALPTPAVPVAVQSEPTGTAENQAGNRANDVTALSMPPSGQTADRSADSIPRASKTQNGTNTTGTVAVGSATNATGHHLAASDPNGQTAVGQTVGKTGSTRSNTTGGNTTSALAPVPPNLGTFTIEVTENHGQTVIADKQVAVVKGESLMDYMHSNFQIVTAYGDNFMVAINGIHSQWTDVPASQRQPVDWFLYLNGQEAPVGAGSVDPKSGDVDQWDYHRWDPSTGRG